MSIKKKYAAYILPSGQIKILVVVFISPNQHIQQIISFIILIHFVLILYYENA
jgi:hypothetical protein